MVGEISGTDQVNQNIYIYMKYCWHQQNCVSRMQTVKSAFKLTFLPWLAGSEVKKEQKRSACVPTHTLTHTRARAYMVEALVCAHIMFAFICVRVAEF